MGFRLPCRKEVIDRRLRPITTFSLSKTWQGKIVQSFPCTAEPGVNGGSARPKDFRDLLHGEQYCCGHKYSFE